MPPSGRHPSPIPGILGGLAGLLLSLLPLSGTAQPFTLAPLEAGIPESDFRDTYQQRLFSLATAINQHGNMLGVYMLPDGTVKSYNVRFATNPAFSVVDSPDFISLAGGEPVCGWFCITEWPFGIRLTEGSASTAWLTTPVDSSPLPGSLPFSRYPGNFVEENRDGVVATTQEAPEGQFAAILDGVGMLILLPDIQWLVALTSGAEPLVLGYRGDDGRCLVYGEGCEPPECEEDAEHGDGHQNPHGRGHREHGRGHGYGHDRPEPCADDSTAAELQVAGEPVLIRARTDNSVLTWTFPVQLAAPYANASVTRLFPLTMNDQRVVLRASVEIDGARYENRLLSCTLSPAIDNNGDGIVDCDGGLTPLVPLAASTPVDTVIGFSLNSAGLLLGNYGYNAAGIGTPFLVDTAAVTPRQVPLYSLARGDGSWELNNVTGINDSATVVGYGYADCSEQPESWFLSPEDTASPGLTAEYRQQTDNAAVLPGELLTPDIPVTGGSGDYHFSMQSKTPRQSEWQPVHDWQPRPGPFAAPTDYLGDVCLRVRIRDNADATLTAERVIRVLVTDNLTDGQPTTPRIPDLLGDRAPDEDSTLEELVGPWPLQSLLMLLIAGFLRHIRAGRNRT